MDTMNNVIEVFGFNTTSGKMFEMRNATIEEIRSAMKERFPKWSDEAIEKTINNQSHYQSVIPVESEDEKKKKVKKGSIAKESICINGFELNPILSLGQSIHAYNKNAYRVWGNEPNRILNNPTVARMMCEFEKAYDEVVVSIKSKPMASKGTITTKVIEMCNKMESLKNTIEKKQLLEQDSNKEYICGNGRRLGIGELMKRVGEISGDVSNLK